MAVTLLRSLFNIANPIPLESVVGRMVRPTHWITLIFTIISISLLKPLWYDGDVLAFRDSCHFYYPLWQYIDSLPASQQLFPMWNPLDAFGSSIIGEPTSMVFYPLRGILLVPILNLENRIGWFLVAHLFIGYFGWLHAGNRVLTSLGNNNSASKTVVCLTGAAYTLSGPVFFQIYNPPFLAGACWLPLVMGEIVGHWCKASDGIRFSFPSPVLIGSLSMMFLAGDIQMVYHILLITGLVVSCEILFDVAFRTRQFSLPKIGNQLVWYLLMIVLLLSITAIQSIPTYFWYQVSERVAIQNSLSDRPDFHALRDYSIAWWEYLSLIQADCFGSFVPTHTRWAQAFDPRSRMWIPSLHVGTVALAGAVIIFPAIVQRLNTRADAIDGRSTTDRRLSVCLVALLTLVISVASSLEQSGLDSLWRTHLPLYSGFRYAAKWSVLMVWSISFLALMGWNHWLAYPQSKLPTIVCIATLICSGLGFLYHIFIVLNRTFSDALRVYFYRIQDDPLCGPFDYDLAIKLFGWSSATNIVIVAIVLVILWRIQSKGTAVLFLALVSIMQLSSSARNQISTVPRTLFVNAAENRLDERIHRVISSWGNPSQSTILPTSVAEASQSDWNNPELKTYPTPIDLVLRQIERRIGKLHLFYKERSFVADFSLRPRNIDATMREHPLNYWQVFSGSDAANESASPFTKVTVKPREMVLELSNRKEQSIDIPVLQDGGWSAESRLAEIESECIGSRIRLNFHEDAQQVKLVYFTPGLVTGAVVSLLGCCVFGILQWRVNNLSPWDKRVVNESNR